MTPNHPGGIRLKQENPHYLKSLQYWSLITAYGLAAAAGIKLRQEHIELLYWVRAEYDRAGNSDVESLLRKVEKDFRTKHARDYLKKLFPANPISQWFYIAGLPVIPEKQYIH